MKLAGMLVNNMKNLTIISFLLLFGSYGFSQTISNSWYSEEDVQCFTFDSVQQCLIMTYYYDAEECDRLKYKVKDNILTIYNYSNQRLLWWEKEKTVFRINKLTSNELHLTLISSEDLAMQEYLGLYENETHQFKFTFCQNGCDERMRADVEKRKLK